MNNKTKLLSVLWTMRDPAQSSKRKLFYGLPGGFYVPVPFADLVGKRIADVVPLLSGRGAYSAAELLGPDLWSALDSAEARLAKLFVADMVTKGEVALRVVGIDCDGPALYLTGTWKQQAQPIKAQVRGRSATGKVAR